MAIPRRKSRPIIIRGKRYRWLFDPKMYQDNARIAIQWEGGSSSTLVVVLIGWQDPWSFPSKTVPNNPQRVTPSFVAECVKFALNTGWQPHACGAPFEVHYASGFRAIIPAPNKGLQWSFAR